MIDNPSYQDFATHDDSAFPELWDGCVGAWAPCLGPSGLRLHDMSGNANWGTLTNMDAATDWVVDSGKYALDFDGSNDRVEGPDVYGAMPRITVSAWVYWRSIPTTFTSAIVAKWENEQGFAPGDAWVLNAGASQGLRWFIGSGSSGGGAVTGAATIATGKWTHCMATYDGARAPIYIDGRLSATGNFSVTMNAAVGVPLRIGRSDIVSPGFSSHDGFIDDVIIFNRILNANDARLLHQIGRGGMYQPRRRRKAYSFGPTFNAAWARGSNVILQPSVGVA